MHLTHGLLIQVESALEQSETTDMINVIPQTRLLDLVAIAKIGVFGIVADQTHQTHVETQRTVILEDQT